MTNRYRTSIEARFEIGAVAAAGEIENVGPGGLFVGTHAIPTEGDTVTLEFREPSGGKIRVRGIVWWTTAERAVNGQTPGFGVRLLDGGERYDGFVQTLAS